MPLFRVGKPRLLLGLTANRTVAAGVTPISWDTAIFEDPSWWSSSTPTLVVIPVTGLWLVELNVNRVSGSSNNGNAGIGIQRNGTTKRAQYLPMGANTSTDYDMCVTYLSELDEGDEIRGVNIVILGTSALGSGRTQLGITRIGPKRWT